MRLLDETPVDPEIVAALDAIDATLAGEPVAPEYAELAELALLLRAERAAPSTEFAGELDNRVWRRFAPEGSAGGGGQRRAGRWWLWTPAAGLATAVAVAIAIVVGAPGGGSSAGSGGAVNGAVASAPRAPAHKQAWTAAASAVEAPAVASTPAAASAKSLASSQSASVNSSGQPYASQSLPATLQPPSNGRKIIQGAQLSLTTNPNRIDTVAQEVFDVVGQVHGLVNSSTVTATGGPSGYAQFQLSIPSGSMPQAMASLSVLQYARVASRTDTTQDVNNQYQGDVAKLASDRAIRASLLKQLANAITQGQIDSLTIRLHDINAAISGDQATLQSLNNQISYSQVNVTINGGQIPTPIPVQHGASGFGLHQAAHDAGRVLTVAAGVVLIGLAALAPIALLAALVWWIAATIRRRRREHALDLV